MSSKLKNPAVPVTSTPISLTIDGVAYKNIHFTNNDLASLEMEIGANFLSGPLSIAQPGFANTRALLYLALKKSGKSDISLEEAGNMVTLDNMADIWAALFAAYSGSQAQAPNPPVAQTAV